MANKDGINPAMSFISQESIDRAEEKTSNTKETLENRTQRLKKAPKGYKINPIYIEIKSERIQLLVQPSLKEKLKEKAKRDGRSLNDLAHTILEDALTEK